jgi:hypothetical protein
MARLMRFGYLKRAWVPLWLHAVMSFLFIQCHMKVNDNHRIVTWNE